MSDFDNIQHRPIGARLLLRLGERPAETFLFGSDGTQLFYPTPDRCKDDPIGRVVLRAMAQ